VALSKTEVHAQREFLMTIRMPIVAILFSTFVGCAGSDCGESDCADTGAAELRGEASDLEEAQPSRSTWEGTPEGVGLIEFINDEATTMFVLDKTVALDRRAAGNIVAHRDGGDRLWGTTDDDVFNTVDELDAVRFVGPRSLDRMVVYAAQTGWVPGAEDILGVYDGVAFSVAEAEATIEMVNSLSLVELDDSLRLNALAAESIVLAQPIATVDELARLYYVGHSALVVLKSAAESVTDSVAGGYQGEQD
jgi:hypothetical protein